MAGKSRSKRAQIGKKPPHEPGPPPDHGKPPKPAIIHASATFSIRESMHSQAGLSVSMPGPAQWIDDLGAMAWIDDLGGSEWVMDGYQSH